LYINQLPYPRFLNSFVERLRLLFLMAWHCKPAIGSGSHGIVVICTVAILFYLRWTVNCSYTFSHTSRQLDKVKLIRMSSCFVIGQSDNFSSVFTTVSCWNCCKECRLKLNDKNVIYRSDGRSGCIRKGHFLNFLWVMRILTSAILRICLLNTFVSY